MFSALVEDWPTPRFVSLLCDELSGYWINEDDTPPVAVVGGCVVAGARKIEPAELIVANNKPNGSDRRTNTDRMLSRIACCFD